MNMLAQINESTLQEYFPPARHTNINSFTNVLIPILLTGAGIILLIMLFRGAFQIITAGGDAEAIQSGQRLFRYAILGFVVVLLSFIVVKLLGFILNVEVFI